MSKTGPEEQARRNAKARKKYAERLEESRERARARYALNPPTEEQRERARQSKAAARREGKRYVRSEEQKQRDRESSRRNYAKYPEKHKERERSRCRTEQQKAKARESVRKRNYGITKEQYGALYASQGGVCAICQKQPSHKAHAVDHCHATGAIRGILCSLCNTGLGYFKDDSEALERAAAYLRTHATGLSVPARRTRR